MVALIEYDLIPFASNALVHVFRGRQKQGAGDKQIDRVDGRADPEILAAFKAQLAALEHRGGTASALADVMVTKKHPSLGSSFA
jgi:hypothetical protein